LDAGGDVAGAGPDAHEHAAHARHHVHAQPRSRQGLRPRRAPPQRLGLRAALHRHLPPARSRHLLDRRRHRLRARAVRPHRRHARLPRHASAHGLGAARPVGGAAARAARLLGAQLWRAHAARRRHFAHRVRHDPRRLLSAALRAYPRRMRRAAVLVCAGLLAASTASARHDAHPFQRGICYAHAWSRDGDVGYGSAVSQKTLARLHRLGVEWISLTPFGFMESTSAVEIRAASAHGAGETDERMRLEVMHAHALGMKVALKPHLWIRRGEWQGNLVFASDDAWRKWFASYRSFILRYAALAERDHYDMLVLGTELKSATACDPECWRALIAELRAAYHGPLTYAANWDEAEKVPF